MKPRNVFVVAGNVVEWQDLLWTSPADRRPAYKIRAVFPSSGETRVAVMHHQITRRLPDNWEVAT